MGKPSKDTIDYYILPNKILCSLYGMWPSDEERSTSKKVFSVVHFAVSLFLVFSIIVPEMIILLSKWTDLSILAGTGCIIMTIAQLLFKTVYLLTKRERAHTLYKELRSLWCATDDPVERQSYEVFAYWARTCTITFTLSCVGTVTMFMLSATYDYVTDENVGSPESSRHLPYDVWRGIDFIDSPEFEIIFVCQVLGSVVCCFAACGMDATFMTIILHLSGQFRLITKWLSKIGVEMRCNQIDRHYCPPNVTAGLIRCIRHHQRLIRVVKDANSLLTPIIFMQVLTSSVVICLGGYAMISNNTPEEQFKFISYILSVLIQLLVWCWPGEILVQESLEIGYAVYADIPWYMLPPLNGRQLCLTVLKSQRYCSMSAFIFNSLSIYTLTNVLNTAFSYFALLRQVQDKAT